MKVALFSVTRGLQRLFLSPIPFDCAFLGILALLLLPAFWLARLPLTVDLVGMTSAYWGGTAVRATFVAILLAIIGLPFEQTLIPCFRRYREEKARIVIALILAVSMCFLFGFWLGLVITVDGLALLELMGRRRQGFEAALADIFCPAFYLCCGAILVFAFNHAIAGIRYAGTYDPIFDHLDWLIFHVNVSRISHWGLNHLPMWLYALMEIAYYSLYGQIGGAIVLSALLGSRRYALHYVRTLLIGYLIALLVFFALPTIGPFSISPLHLSSGPSSLVTSRIQDAILTKARMLWAHNSAPDVISVNLKDYYIGFPCMHVALPLIAIWFLRPWKRIAFSLLIFDAMLLVPSIILLEWHFLVDILAGFVVALVAVFLTNHISKRSNRGALQISCSMR